MATTDRASSGDRATYQIRALDRGLDILEAFTLADPELTIGQIGERTNLPKPTVVRLLSVLGERGYVERIAGAERYRLGVRTLEVGSVFLLSTSLEAEARPIMRKLADATGQTANLGILHDWQVVHIEVVAPDRPVRFWAMIGKREDAYVSGLGKVLLAALPESDRESYLSRPLPAVTPTTITDPDQLREELIVTAERGYAIDNEESNAGVICIAAPIRNGKGGIEAAVSISGPRAEFDADGQMARLTDLVRGAASDISARLGWSG
ncbi:MAG TPA: IclR family transcriptional regulator [Thermomicrobiales bacterium]|nr:IclR family transcriptional regulator [Thermomicrobiales bacterium]